MASDTAAVHLVDPITRRTIINCSELAVEKMKGGANSDEYEFINVVQANISIYGKLAKAIKYDDMPSPEDLNHDAVAFVQHASSIVSALQNGKKALVFCKNGRSRSPCVVAAFYIIFRGLPLREIKTWFNEVYPRQRPVTAAVSSAFPNIDKFENILNLLGRCLADPKKTAWGFNLADIVAKCSEAHGTPLHLAGSIDHVDYYSVPPSLRLVVFAANLSSNKKMSAIEEQTTNSNKNRRTAAATTEPIEAKMKNSISGKKQSNKKSGKNNNDTKGKKKNKFLMYYENESVSDGSRFSGGGFGPSSPTMRCTEANIGVASAQKRLTYRAKQHMSAPETAEERVSSGGKCSAIYSSSDGTETESDDVSEISSVDQTFQAIDKTSVQERVVYSLTKSQKYLPWAELWKEMRAEGWRFLPGSKNVDYYYAHPRCAGMNKTKLLCGKKGLDYFESEEELQVFAKQRLGWKGEKLLPPPGETMMSSPQKAAATNKRKERNISKEVPSPTKKSRTDYQLSSAKPVPKSPTPYNKAPSPANSKQSSTASRSTASRSKKNFVCLPDKQLTYKDKLEYCKLTLHPSYKLKTGRLSSTSNSVVEQLENQIKLFMKRAMETGRKIDVYGMSTQSPGFMYICGGPGTGKTTAVAACLQHLANWASELGVAKPCSCHINIASISNGAVKKEMFKVMSKKLQIDKSSSEAEFINQFRKKGMILVVDEVDMLFKSHGGSGDEWFSTLIEWCEDKELPFSMIGISTSVNDRYATKIRELSNNPQELVFPNYNETDLLDILQKRVGKKIVDTEALQLIVKRVAASTGDARKVLEITSNAVDNALDASSEKWLEEVEYDCYPLVKLPHMMRAIREGMSMRQKEIIRGLPQAAKVILCIAVSLGQAWGPTAAVSIATLKKYAVEATKHAVLDDASLGQISNLVKMLMDSGLLTTDHDHLHLRVQLDDVEIALEKTLLEESSFYRSLVDYVKRECPHPE